MRKLYCLIVCSVVLAAIAARLMCAGQPELMVAAAASLTDAFTQIGKAYEKKHPQAAVKFDFASSGALATQIEQGAPVDVFASADADNVDRLARKGLVTLTSRTVFASNTVVVIVPSGFQTAHQEPGGLEVERDHPYRYRRPIARSQRKIRSPGSGESAPLERLEGQTGNGQRRAAGADIRRKR